MTHTARIGEQLCFVMSKTGFLENLPGYRPSKTCIVYYFKVLQLMQQHGISIDSIEA